MTDSTSSATDDLPPLVLLHAFPVDSRMWDGVRERLAARTRVITPDQRGLGRTALPESDRAPDLDDAAADVLAMLDRLGLRRVVLGGCSMGGYLTMAILRAAPERVAGIVLIDTKHDADGEQARENRLRVADRSEREGIGGWLAEEMLENLLGADTRQTRADVTETTRELIESQPASGIAWAQRAMAERPDSTETLRHAAVPALVVVGEQDTLTSPEQAQRMAALFGNSSLVTLPGTGHLAPLEAPEQVAEAISGWLARLR